MNVQLGWPQEARCCFSTTAWRLSAGSGAIHALRHGHYAYYSTTTLVAMLSAVGFHARTTWKFDLYGGTVLLAAGREADEPDPGDEVVNALLTAEAWAGITEPHLLAGLQNAARGHARALREWLEVARTAGQAVLRYGAASRAVALLNIAAVDGDLLPAVADASPAKQESRMPGTAIPVISPVEFIARAGFGVGTTTSWRYVNDTAELQAARAPKLGKEVRDAKKAGYAYVVVDGTLIPIDRLAADRPFYSGKHKKHGMNLQVIASLDGDLLWVSGALPGSVHDKGAEWIWGVLATSRGPPVWSPSQTRATRSAAGRRFRTKGRTSGNPRKRPNAPAKLRAPGERANGQLKTWKILAKLRCCLWRAGQLAKAIHGLQAREA